MEITSPSFEGYRFSWEGGILGPMLHVLVCHNIVKVMLTWYIQQLYEVRTCQIGDVRRVDPPVLEQHRKALNFKTRQCRKIMVCTCALEIIRIFKRIN